METLQTKNQVEYTEDETRLAERYKVEPKTVRLISEIVSVHTEGINKLIGLMQAEQEQPAEPEQVESQEQPEQEKGPGSTIEDMVEEWLRQQDYKTKLAIYIFWEYLTGDHGTGDLTDRVSKEYKAEVLQMATNPDNSLSKEDTIMTGIACELFVWSKNL